MIEVIITDDHPVVRQGIKRLINSKSDDINIVGSAANAYELFKMLEKKSVDLILLDITMPGKNGLDALKELRLKYPGIRIIMLTRHPEDRYALRSIRAGASGYLSKENVYEELIQAIYTVARDGKKYINPSVAEELAKIVDGSENNESHSELSDREFEIFLMIASGKSVSQIADELLLSKSTVYTYHTRIIHKLKLKSDIDITQYAIEHNLLE